MTPAIWILLTYFLRSTLTQVVLPTSEAGRIGLPDGSFVGDSIQVNAAIQTGDPQTSQGIVEPLDPQQRNYQNGGTINLDGGQYVEPYAIEYKYHDFDKMTKFLRQTTARYPSLTALYSIGKSIQGRDLWVMVVSASPYEHMIGKPDVKYVGNMHGNEAISRELLLHLIHHLVTSYSTDPYIRWLLDNTRIHIMPSMNPDGFEVSKEGTCDGGQGRYNARGFDLNRNFPDYFKQNNKRTQPETEAVKEWISKIQFVLSGSLHGGALVASYPFDNTPNSHLKIGVRKLFFHNLGNFPHVSDLLKPRASGSDRVQTQHLKK